ncbi:hypothetical protein D3C80_2083790 [compost metagenome]
MPLLAAALRLWLPLRMVGVSLVKSVTMALVCTSRLPFWPFMFSRSQPSRPVLSSAVAANSAVRSA